MKFTAKIILVLMFVASTSVGAQKTVRLPEALWTQTQIDNATASGTTPIRWAEANIYGGLNTGNYPVNPAKWDQLTAYASIPAQTTIQFQAQPAVGHQVLELHRPETISQRFLWQYDAGLSNVIYVEHHGEKWNNRFFDFHFLEDLFIPQKEPKVTFVNNRIINDNLFLWSRPSEYQQGVSRDEFLFYMIQSDSIYFECAGHVWIEGNQTFWQATIINHSEYNWVHPECHAPGALMCFRTRNNPDFGDEYGQRIYYYSPDGRRLVKSVYDIDGYTSSYFHHWTFQPDAEYSNKLTKFNQTGELWVTAQSEPPRSVHGNRINEISCIHANIGWSIPQGTWQTIKWMATFQNLSTTTSWRLYQ